jgi:hypothetical protein
MSEAYTVLGSTTTSDIEFSYDEYGHMSDMYQSSTHSGGYFHTTATYFDNDSPSSIAAPGMSTMTYGLDGRGRLYSANSGGALVNSVTYNSASQPLVTTYGNGSGGSNGDTDANTWDAASGKQTETKFTIGATPVTDTLNWTWNANGTLGQLGITDNNSGSTDTQTCNDTHDDIVRITTWNCGSLWNESYAYTPDYAGNVTKSGSLSFAPGYTAATNRMLAPYTYDNNGNLLHDATLSIDNTWDGYGNMASSTGVSIVNSAFGNMVEKTVGTTNTFYLFSPLGRLGAMSNLTTVSNVFIPLPGGALLRVVPGSNVIQHRDWMGSTRMTSTRSGRAFGTAYSYGPMGEVYVGLSANQLFAGSTSDTKTGLDDFGPIRYGWAMGRNIQPTGAENGYVRTNSPF